ncbi:hypothetical protein C2857_007335 [Epichloe festucae Fl1]|uniref:AMP-activated protein kinase glycogen-binding domain-containing protein n=1 Tax=Epichloe festucae (strain Fl1) TaxID=877507 RepID=A0A7S9PUZ0_EPIFF|nr:hypothetical protein C2857_007335 [Epichloe festucae Fl1]
MGSFTFKWANPTTDPSDVLVTGSFDGWTKSVKLEKDRGIFQKTVQFSEKDAANKIYYKFVVDNNWIINESYPYEPDHEGNVNNFLTSEDLVKPTPAPGSDLVPAPFINTVTPESTTVADMGKKNNNNNNKKGKVATKQAGAEATPAQPAAVAAAAAAPEIAGASEAMATPSDVPGGFPSTPSNEGADWEHKTVSINPLPATAGFGNPITLAPGEKIPESLTSQNVNEHVKLDKASYEKSDALPTAPALSTEAPSVSGVMIPESSLFMGEQTDVTNATINSVGAGSTTAALAGQVPLESKVPDATNATINSVGAGSTTAALAGQVPLESKVPDATNATNATINSVGAGSTTAALAGQVPLEPKVPDVVKESQEKASVAPKASTMPEEVKDKAKVEEEIKNIVPEAPATSVGTAGVGTEKKENTGTVLGAAAATGGAAVAAAVAAVNKFSTDAAPAVNDAKNATAEIVSKNLPDSVKNSLPVSAQNALATEKTDSPTENVSPAVPREVKESIAEAGKSPEAAVSTSAVQDKRAVESELLKEVKEAPAVSDVTKSSPAADTKVTESTPVMTKPVETEPVAVKAVDDKPVDVKPAETHPAAATTTTASAAAATTTEIPSTTANTTATPTAANGTETKIMEPSSTTTAAAANGNGSEAKPAGSTMGDKKKNRLSVMLGKLKAKLK